MINKSNVSTIYVSQEYGHDGENGFFAHKGEFLNGPVKTFKRAFWLIREIRSFGYNQPITIKVMDKEFTVDSTIEIDGDINNVTIEPYSKTLISGGRKVTGFKHDTFNNVPCFSAVIPEIEEGVWYTDFYVDNNRADFTHYPSKGTLEPIEVENNSTNLGAHSKWFIAKNEDLQIISKFRNFNDCFISYNHYWVDEHSPVESFDFETGKIVFEYESKYSISFGTPESALHYIIENVAEQFKNPNEWYLDRETKKLYYIPANNNQTPENINAYLPVVNKIFDIKGTLDKSVRNIVIRNFEIAYTRGDSKWRLNNSETFVGSCGQAVSEGIGAIEMKHAKHCFIENCQMHSMGIHAIHLYDGCENIRISDNEIYDLGGGGIVTGGASKGMDARLHTGNNIISNNIIKNLGKRYYSAVGILLLHTFGNTVSHNEISDLYYSGISVGWVWGYGESISENNIIEYNHIFDLGKGVLSDMGGIYLLGKQQGTVVRNNIIHDVKSKHYGGWGIYTDEGSSYIVVENNICYNLSSDCFHQHYGAMNVVRNNIFVLSNETPIKITRNEMHIDTIFERNIIVAKNTSIYNLEGWFDDKRNNHCEQIHVMASHNNLIFDEKNDKVVVLIIDGKEYGLEEVQKLFGLENGTIEADPKFVSPEKYDFSLREDSPAHKIAFKPINTEHVGGLRGKV